ncbi:MAG: alpha/beta hydrolase [candidate division Zixibacteria bacterium]|nr:alpha/beta hydrolase [candidate division Zixibacteria bacterium]
MTGVKKLKAVLLFGLMLMAAIGLMLVSCGQKTDTASESAVIVDSTASADGVMIHYRVMGSNNDKALVFVHCWSGDQTYWDETVKAFKDNYKVVTLDLAGHGRSGMNRDEWTIEAFGADVAAVVNKLGLKNVILVGHSMGGAVNIAAANLLPEQVVALIGVDTYQNLQQKMSDEQIKQFTAAFEADFPGVVRQFVSSMFPPTADTALVRKVADDMAAAPKDVAMGAIMSLFKYDAPTALETMRKPIRGINADMVPVSVEGNKAVAESFEVTVLPGYGHFLQLEDPVTFNRELKEAIEEFWPAE